MAVDLIALEQALAGADEEVGEYDLLDLMDGTGESIDLGRAWHAIHFLITGMAEEGKTPLDFLLAGGEEIAEVDVGNGPARAFDAAKTAAIAEAFSEISDEDVRSRYDADKMVDLEIYPEIWQEVDEEAEHITNILEKFSSLRTLLESAQEASTGILISVL